MPDIVTNQDLDAEVSNDEAFTRYAIPSYSFMVLQKQDLFDASVIYDATLNMQDAQTFTDAFLAPFREAFAVEDNDGDNSPWVAQGMMSYSSDGMLKGLSN